MLPGDGPRAAFYFDLASPHCYLAAERVLQELPGPLEWQPVRIGQSGPFERGQIERRAQAIGLQPLRWPSPLPFDSALAMRAATYAKSIGRVVPFAQAAFRQAFAGGHSLAELDFVLIAAAACEMHPRAVAQAVRSPAQAQRLAAASAGALAEGVSELPALRLGERLFMGPSALEEATSLCSGALA